jgi:hypothetical protein
MTAFIINWPMTTARLAMFNPLTCKNPAVPEAGMNTPQTG